MSEPQIDIAIAKQQAHYRRRAELGETEEVRLWGTLMVELVAPIIAWISNHAVRATNKGVALRAVTCAAAAMVGMVIKISQNRDNEHSDKSYAVTLFEDELARLLRQRNDETTITRTNS